MALRIVADAVAPTYIPSHKKAEKVTIGIKVTQKRYGLHASIISLLFVRRCKIAFPPK